jgi:hypothetical protein
MTTTPVYGYMRLALVGRRGSEVDRQIRHVAAGFGGAVRRVFVEPAPAVNVLWSLVMGLDRLSSGQVVPALMDIADREGVDIRRLIGGRAGPATQWRALLAEIIRAGGGDIVIPSPEHLDGLAESTAALLQQLSRSQPRIQVVFLSDLPPANQSMPRPRRPVAPVGNGSVLVGEFTITAFTAELEVALLKARWHLSHAGLAYRADEVAALLRALIQARIAPQPPDEPDTIRIRLLRTAHTLVVDVHETENHATEPVPATVSDRCMNVRRLQSITGGTATWCELPLADPDTPLPPAGPAGRSLPAAAPASGGAPW